MPTAATPTPNDQETPTTTSPPTTPAPAPTATKPDTPTTKPTIPTGKAPWWMAKMQPWGWEHPPTWGAINTSGAILGGTMIANLIGMPAPLGIIGGTVGGLAALAAGLVDDITPARLLWRAGTWITSGVWVTWALTASPWNPACLGALGIMTSVTGTVATIRSRRKRTRDAQDRAHAKTEQERQQIAVALDWEDRIRRVTGVSVSVAGIRAWETGAGFTLQVLLPKGGATVSQLSAHLDGLATDARLPNGCEITIRQGRYRGSLDIDVSTVDILDDLIPCPESTPLSIDNGLPVGLYRESSLATIDTAWDCAALVGQVGSGKTNLLNVINLAILRCVDTCLWHIDLTGGISRPWVRPYYEGRVTHPMVDWGAYDPTEADLLCDAAIAIIDARKGIYEEWMRQCNDDKIHVTPNLPQIIIVVDEAGKLPTSIMEKLRVVSDTGRAARVRIIYCGLRATSEYMPPAIKSQARVLVGLRVTRQEELAYLFGWHAVRSGLDTQAAQNKGCGFIQDDGGAPRPFKGFRITPSEIDAAVEKVVSWRPLLDEPSAQVADEATDGAYSSRLDRMIDFLFKTKSSRGQATVKRPDPSPKQSSISHLFDAKPGTPTEALERLRGTLDRIKEENGITGPEPAGDDETFADIVAHMSVRDPRQDEVAAPELSGRDLVLDIVKAAAEGGIETAELLATYAARGGTEHPTTVKGWLGELVKAGQLKRPRQGWYVFPV